MQDQVGVDVAASFTSQNTPIIPVTNDWVFIGQSNTAGRAPFRSLSLPDVMIPSIPSSPAPTSSSPFPNLKDIWDSCTTNVTSNENHFPLCCAYESPTNQGKTSNVNLSMYAVRTMASTGFPIRRVACVGVGGTDIGEAK